MGVRVSNFKIDISPFLLLLIYFTHNIYQMLAHYITYSLNRKYRTSFPFIKLPINLINSLNNFFSRWNNDYFSIGCEFKQIF